MTKITYYFDNRRPSPDGTFPVRIRIARNSARTFVTTPIKMTADEWAVIDDTREPRLRGIKRMLDRMRMDIEDVAYDLERDGFPTPADIKQEYEDRSNPLAKEKRLAAKNENSLLRTWFLRRMELKKGKTLSSIRQTLAKIDAFDPNAKLDKISPAWLEKFDAFMAETAPSPNARAVHMRNLRAVINFAIDEEATNNYPFRRFHIKTVTTEKRSLTVEELRAFFAIKCADDADRKYLDMFKLTFFLIGINAVDLLHLLPSDLVNGRIVFNRSKTKKLYSIKVEPEAMEIIDRYRGDEHLINPLDTVGHWENFTKRVNKAISSLGDTTLGKRKKKERTAMFPNLTLYWARHTWATLAAELDIPKETISAALGHGGNTVTDIYINFNRKKIDEANRKVIDYVLGK